MTEPLSQTEMNAVDKMIREAEAGGLMMGVHMHKRTARRLYELAKDYDADEVTRLREQVREMKQRLDTAIEL